MSKKTIFVVYLIAIIVAGSLEFLNGPKQVDGHQYTHYENYLIFKNSFKHLSDGQDLYAAYPEETWDVYKYSPTFAVLMAPFSLFPDWLGLNLWNLLNGLLLFWAIYTLPGMEQRKKILLLWFILIELITSIQNSQSNGLMAALMIFSYGALENRKLIWAGLLISLSVYIKLFGAVMLLFIFLYDKKMRQSLIVLCWLAALWIMPLLFRPLSAVWQLYQSWFQLLSSDQAVSFGLSVMGWLHTWLGLDSRKIIVPVIGLFLLIPPFFSDKMKIDRHALLASVLIWVVIFNHKAESPTFVIAMCGIGLWYFMAEPTRRNRILLILAFVLISLSPTDIFPQVLRNQVVVPYVLKAFPAILIWLLLQYELLNRWFREYIVHREGK